MNPFPPLRYVDAVPMEHEGAQIYFLKDPLGYVEEPAVLSSAAFFIAACLDGKSTARTIQRGFAAEFGGAPPHREEIEQVVAFLDERGYLASPQFEAIRQRVEAEFRDAPARPAYFAGKSYPSDPEDLREMLDACLLRGKATDTQEKDCLKGLVVPHIDYQRGGHVYATGYQALASQEQPDVVIIFGVAHAGAGVPFVLTRKGFETPFGTLQTETGMVDALAEACDWDPYAWEIVHRTEHSIEFQATMLSYLFGPQIRIVPILCAAFSENPHHAPSEIPGVEQFLARCRELVAESDMKITVLAAADLAHVGRSFGDDFELDEAIMSRIRARDMEDLGWVTACAPEAFYAAVMQDQNARRVCGLGCIYAALKSVEGSINNAELLHYDSAPDPAGGIVSFAALRLQ